MVTLVGAVVGALVGRAVADSFVDDRIVKTEPIPDVPNGTMYSSEDNPMNGHARIAGLVVGGLLGYKLAGRLR